VLSALVDHPQGMTGQAAAPPRERGKARGGKTEMQQFG